MEKDLNIVPAYNSENDHGLNQKLSEDYIFPEDHEQR